jgi:hypothetical protein
MKRFVLAAICTFALVGIVMAEEFTLQITKISDDGTSVTGTKLAIGKGGKGGKGGFGKGEEVTVKLASSVKVMKGKFDTDAKKFVGEGDDLKLAGLKAAILRAENGSVTVSGTALTDADKLELSFKNGKPMARLNGKDIDFADVRVVQKGPLNTRVTTDDSGNVTEVLLTPGGGGFGGKGGKGKGGGGN